MPHGGIVLVNGLKVIVSDPDPDIASKVAASVAAALPALAGLGFETTYVPAMLSFEKGQFPAVGSATIVQECGPERVEFKQELWKDHRGRGTEGCIVVLIQLDHSPRRCKL